MDINENGININEIARGAAKVNQMMNKLLSDRLELTNRISNIKKDMIEPLNDVISQIDSEVYNLMTKMDIDKHKANGYGAYMSNQTVIKVVDKRRALDFVSRNPQILKSDIFKNSEINKLIKEGIVPDPLTDGIDCNDSYKKVTYRRS